MSLDKCQTLIQYFNTTFVVFLQNKPWFRARIACASVPRRPTPTSASHASVCCPRWAVPWFRTTSLWGTSAAGQRLRAESPEQGSSAVWRRSSRTSTPKSPVPCTPKAASVAILKKIYFVRDVTRSTCSHPLLDLLPESRVC